MTNKHFTIEDKNIGIIIKAEKFDPEFSSSDSKPILFKTKEEWDQSYYSNAAFELRVKENEARWKRNGRMDSSGGPYEVAANEPDKFPCIAIQAGIRRNHNGPDEMMFGFIYDITIMDGLERNQPMSKEDEDKDSKGFFK